MKDKILSAHSIYVYLLSWIPSILKNMSTDRYRFLLLNFGMESGVAFGFILCSTDVFYTTFLKMKDNTVRNE